MGFDYVTAFDAIHDQTRPLAALMGVYHILAPGGVFSMIDIAAETDVHANIGHPMGPFLYTVSMMHCMPVGLMDGGTGLGMMWGRQQAVKLLRKAGFSDISVEAIPEDAFNDHFLCRK
jgi:SAM-dependent methyltransferase